MGYADAFADLRPDLLVLLGDRFEAFAAAAAIAEFDPSIIYTVHGGDVHSDHRIVSTAVWIATKPLRGNTVRRVLAFETLSSTNLADPTRANTFEPQAFSDISPYLAKKLEILGLYESEMMPFPSPRSIAATEALARYRGSTVHCDAAEAFMVLRDYF